ncbi:LAFA_0D17392g1_1 [Lachancea sp. 'fantastica']|nr:LAFA_0D17392g1_1 [Lachancea sp. 'fantastica']
MSEFVLNQGYGYGIVLGLGALFSALMILISWAIAKFFNQKQDSERFTTASRNVKQGLISSAVVSSWTWPATLLTSNLWTYSYGIAGAYWYSVTGCFQILLFTLVAIEIKLKCPGIHTIAEVARVRFGKWGHFCYLFYSLGTNVIVSGMILLGGSQGIAYTTGMNVIAACFLLPVSVSVYTLFGGLQATFLSDWSHTIVIYIMVLLSIVTVYCTSDLIGSPDKMFDLLNDMAKTFPLESSAKGSYLTFANKDIVLTAWTTLLGGAATVFMDPSYSQKAIAAGSKQVMKGYMLGGLCWQAIPLALGTSMGLASLALTKNPEFFTYPNKLTDLEAGRGLSLVYAMKAFFGKSGAACAVVMIFMSATSAMSAELISCSSILTYDFYKTYINPEASGKRLVYVSHLNVIGFSLCMGALAVIFNYIGVTLGWLFSFVGIVLGPAFFGLLGMLFYKKMNTLALVVGVPLATLCGIVGWVASASHYSSDGTVDKDSLSLTEPLAFGNFISVFSSGIFVWILSQIKSQNWSFHEMNEIYFETQIADDADSSEIELSQVSQESVKDLRKHILITKILVFSQFIIFLIIIPLSMYGTNCIFSRKMFRGYVCILIIWAFLAAMWIIIYPLFESRSNLTFIIKRLLRRELSDDDSDLSPTDVSTDDREKLDKTSIHVKVM